MTSYGDFPSNVDRQSWFARDASKVKHYAILIAYVALLVSNSDPVMGFEATQLHAGYYFDQHIVSSQVLLFDAEKMERITQIGDRIARVASLEESLTYRIINSPVINAYAAPGGFFYLTSGLLSVVETEDELAAVMAHEIAHTAKGDFQSKWLSGDRSAGAAQVGLGLLQICLQIFLAVSAGPAPPSGPSQTFAEGLSQAMERRLDALPAAVLAGVVQTAADLQTAAALIWLQAGYSRKLEQEADDLMIQYTEKTNYNPRAMIDLLKRLQYIRDASDYMAEMSSLSKLFSAEPGIEERIGYLEMNLK